MKNTSFLNALRRQPVERTPIWIMRQAGRYLPEYRASRAKAGNFLKLCQTPEFACEVTLQPLARFDLDAAILFSDILTIADAMGLGLEILDGQGPVIHKPVRTEKEIESLPSLQPEKDLPYVLDAIKLIRRALHDRIPLIGFAGSPWTLAAYLIEGKGSKEFYLLRKKVFCEPQLLHQLLTHLTEATLAYTRAQINAGAQAMMLFDTWGGLLNATHYLTFSLHYLQKIIAGLKQSHPNTPIILYTKNGMVALEERANSGADALGLDWIADLAQARQRVGHQVALQGNLDPAVLYAAPHIIQQHVKSLLAAAGPQPGYIFNLGHGIPLDIPPEHVKVLVDSVHESL